MNKITLQELFAAAKPKLVSEEIKWDGNVATIWFQRLTMEENADIGRPYLNEDGSGIAKDQIKHFQAALLAKTIRDENGANVINDPAEILGWDGAFYQAVLKASEKHNPAGSAALETLAKNSETTPSTASS